MNFAALPQSLLLIPNATAGESFSANACVYKDVFNQRGGGASRWYKVDVTATGPVKISPVVGIAKTAGTAGNGFQVQIGGLVTGLSGLTADAPVWASTAGTLTQSQPGIPASGTQTAVALLGCAHGTTGLILAQEFVTFCRFQSAMTVGAMAAVEHWPDSGARAREAFAYVVSTLDLTLTGYWKLDEGTTNATVIDSSQSGNNGTPNGSPTYTTSVPGSISFTDPDGLTFNGSSQGVDLGQAGLTPTSITVECWVKLNNNTTDQIFIQNYNDSGGRDGFVLGLASNGKVKWILGDGSTNTYTCPASTTLSTGVWYHVCGTFDNTSKVQALYINGALDGSATLTNPLAYSGTSASLGYLRSHTNQYVNGALDDVRVYNRAKATTEISADAAGGATAVYDAPLAVGNPSVNSGATNQVLVDYADLTYQNPTKFTTFTNQTGATRDIALEVVL